MVYPTHRELHKHWDRSAGGVGDHWEAVPVRLRMKMGQVLHVPGPTTLSLGLRGMYLHTSKVPRAYTPGYGGPRPHRDPGPSNPGLARV